MILMYAIKMKLASMVSFLLFVIILTKFFDTFVSNNHDKRKTNAECTTSLTRYGYFFLNCNFNLDDLFGQCWNGEGSERSAFALKTGVDGLTDDKIIATEYTLDFLNRYQLTWRDYMTQCILSHILSTSHQVNPLRLETFYEDCLEKDQYLDELADYQEEEKLVRRGIEYYSLYRSKDK